MRKRPALSWLTVLFVVVAGAVAAMMLSVAAAKITPASCETQGGNQPPGQQPVCQGGGLEQEPATNPAGKPPPGQQP
jgi:hypothetical protein